MEKFEQGGNNKEKDNEIADIKECLEGIIDSAGFSAKDKEVVCFGVEKVIQESESEKEAKEKLEKLEKLVEMIMSYKTLAQNYNPSMKKTLPEISEEIEKQKKEVESLLKIDLESETNFDQVIKMQ